jgi:peroxiredoxin
MTLRERTEMPVEPGDLAPEIDLPDDEGGRWLLSEHHGQPVVLIFHRHLA